MVNFEAFVYMLLPLIILAEANDTSRDRLQELEETVACLQNTLDQLGFSSRPRDCRDVYHQVSQENGVYVIWPDPAVTSSPVHVPCHFDDDGQWIVLQRRVNGDVDFLRGWQDYRKGFGRMDYNADFWLGLERMYQITRQQLFTLRVDLEGWDNSQVYAEYSVFYISDEDSKYAIYYDGYSGTAGDGLGDFHRGMKFTAEDQDNDNYASGNCGQHNGPWWLNACDHANLNGEYGEDKGDRGIEWASATRWKTSSMCIRPTRDL